VRFHGSTHDSGAVQEPSAAAGQSTAPGINRYNRAVQNHNRKVKTAFDNYNREVRAYRQRLRANHQRVQQVIRQLQSRPVMVTRFVDRWIWRARAVTRP
jgi:hypothetical protein